MMNKFKDLSIGSIVVLFIFVIIEIYYFTDDVDYRELALKDLDLNGDGKVSRSELKYYLTEVEKKKKNKQIFTSDLKKSIAGGVVRGFLMGLILNSFEGGLVLGLILGVLNPILAGAERTFM